MVANVIIEGTSALEAELGVLVQQAGSMDSDLLLRPSGLAEWRVVDLLVHVATRVDRLGRAARAEPPLVRQVTLAVGPPPTPALGPPLRPGQPDLVPVVLAREAVAALGETTRRLSRRLAGVEEDRLVTTRLGVMSLGEALLLHCMETLHHALVVARVVGAAPTDLCHPETRMYAAARTGASGAGGVLTQLERPQRSSIACVRWVGSLCPATVSDGLLLVG